MPYQYAYVVSYVGNLQNYTAYQLPGGELTNYSSDGSNTTHLAALNALGVQGWQMRSRETNSYGYFYSWLMRDTSE